MSLPVRKAPITISDVGFAISINLGEDISGFTNYDLLLKSPSDDSVKTEVCQINPEDDCSMILTLQAATFDVPGTWIAQARLTIGVEVKFGAEFEIVVNDQLS